MRQEEVAKNTNMRVDDNTNMQKPPKPRNNSGSSERPRSNRSSLIITHDDGTTEENDCVVTSLGFSHVDSDALTIVEIGQKNKVRSESYEENRMNSPEIVIVDVHRDPDHEAVQLPSFMRDHSPLLEIETLPNSPSPSKDKMSPLSISPPPPQSPSISLSPSPRSSFTGGSSSPQSWAVEASRTLDYQVQLPDSVDSCGVQTVGEGQTAKRMVEVAVKVEEDKRANTVKHTPEQSKSPDDDWEMVRFAATENKKLEENRQSFPKKVLKIPIQLEGEERNLSQTLGKQTQESRKNSNENTRNAKNVARMQMDVDNGSASGTPAIDMSSSPKPVRIIPIEIEIEKDQVKPYFGNEEATLETDRKISDNKVVDKSSDHDDHKRVIPIKYASGNDMSRNSTSTMDDVPLTDINSNGKKPADRFTVPIKIEMNDDTSNNNVDINSETKYREMTKKHFAKQTSRPCTPQQTVTHNEQQERAEAKIINTEKNVRDKKVTCNPLSTRRVPITLEQLENADLCEKESLLRSTDYTEPVETNFQNLMSPTKTQPALARNSTTFPTKPPQGKRNLQIQREALKGEMNKKSTFQRIHQKKGNLDQQNDIKCEVDFEQIQTQLEDAKQKLELQMKQMGTGNQLPRKVEPRSRSVGSESRNLGARPKSTNPRYAFRRERSMEDIDKDIETIWKELQELDKLPRSENGMPNIRKEERYPPEWNQSNPLSEQELVIPSWRTKTPPSNRKVSIPPQPRPVPSPSPRTIWDTPDDRPSSAISQNQRLPPTTNHFSFIPKADTKPGAITPTFININTRLSRSPNRAKGFIKEDPVPVPVRDGNPFAHDRSQSMPRENSAWPECYNSFQKIQGQNTTGAKPKEITPLKSCLKSESRSNSLARTEKTRSKSPSSRDSPSKQNVNFKQETILKKFQLENETSTKEQPYEFIDVRISQIPDKAQKQKTPPIQTKLNDSKNLRVIPIVRDVRREKSKSDNPFTRETKYDPTPSARTVPIQREKETHSNPFLSETDCPIELANKKSHKTPKPEVQSSNIEAPLATEDACYACDACTQTEEKDKKDACHVM